MTHAIHRQAASVVEGNPSQKVRYCSLSVRCELTSVQNPYLIHREYVPGPTRPAISRSMRNFYVWKTTRSLCTKSMASRLMLRSTGCLWRMSNTSSAKQEDLLMKTCRYRRSREGTLSDKTILVANRIRGLLVNLQHSRQRSQSTTGLISSYSAASILRSVKDTLLLLRRTRWARRICRTSTLRYCVLWA